MLNIKISRFKLGSMAGAVRVLLARGRAMAERFFAPEGYPSRTLGVVYEVERGESAVRPSRR